MSHNWFVSAYARACARFDAEWGDLLRLDGDATTTEIGNYRRMYAGGYCDGIADTWRASLAANLAAAGMAAMIEWIAHAPCGDAWERAEPAVDVMREAVS